VGCSLPRPPYELSGVELTNNLVASLPRLAEHAVVVVERSAREAAPACRAGSPSKHRKDYGDTAVYYLAPSPSTADS